MQILITDGGLSKTRAISVSRWQMSLALGALVILLLALSGTVYHFVFLKAAREGWPVVSQLVKLVVRDEIAQRDKFMRENLDAMAQRVGDIQARVMHLETVANRVTGLAGVKADDLKALQRPGTTPATPVGQGGPFVPLDHPGLEQIKLALTQLDQQVEQHSDLLTLAESRLFESRLRALMVPNSRPIEGALGSGFGFRSDPFTGRPALHTGLDFSAEPGTPIMAAAGGMVTSTEWHPQYGHLLEIDHGNGLSTRYAHTSRYLVKVGDLVKRGQVVAEVGTSGRSTGPHLHFEVVVDGVPQDPSKFLTAEASGAKTGSLALAQPAAQAPALTTAPAVRH
jgi:murein DD-endopeptidase MepM/ murein hydrolase activator NlpD